MKKIVYEMIVDIWRLAARYQFGKLSDTQWENFLVEGNTLLEKYRQYGRQEELLYRDLFSAVQAFYQRLETVLQKG